MAMCAHRNRPDFTQRKLNSSFHNISEMDLRKLLNAVGRRVEEIKKEMTCKVCLMNPVQRAFRACGHLCACADCIKQLRECPICRSPVDRGVIVVNLPKPKKRMTVDHELFLKRNNYFGLDCVAGNPRAVR